MCDLTLADIISKLDININDILLVRHSQNKDMQWHYNNGFIREYTSIQKSSFPKKYKYIFSFVGGNKTTAVLDEVYYIRGWYTSHEKVLSQKFLSIIPEHIYNNIFCEKRTFFDLEKIDILKHYEKKLVIEWGKGTLSWYQKAATNSKTILAIYPQKVANFVGYENVILTYSELKQIVEDEILYSDWHTALSGISAIYLITNVKNGKQYIGSAYGSEGLLDRWKCYVLTGHGNNKELVNILKIDDNEKNNFQFSILQILSKFTPSEDVVNLENVYKQKLMTRKFGLNDN